jgi:hypothetical protein
LHSPEALIRFTVGWAETTDAAAAVFAAGETIARCTNGNIVILARRDDSLDGCLVRLVRAMSVDPVLEDDPVRVWVEPLGGSTALLDGLLIDRSA